MTHVDNTGALGPSGVKPRAARSLRTAYILGGVVGVVASVVFVAYVFWLLMSLPSIVSDLKGLDRIGWLFIFVGFMGWLMDSKLVQAQKERAEILRLLQALRARVDACTPAPPPPPSYRWDYRTGEWGPMPEGDV
jgi:hypothetical protein